MTKWKNLAQAARRARDPARHHGAVGAGEVRAAPAPSTWFGDVEEVVEDVVMTVG